MFQAWTEEAHDDWIPSTHTRNRSHRRVGNAEYYVESREWEEDPMIEAMLIRIACVQQVEWRAKHEY